MLRLIPALLLAVFVVASCKSPEKAETPAAADAPKAATAPASQPAKVGKGETPEDRNQVDADGVVRRGEALSAERPLQVSECVAKADALAGKRVKVEGTVTSVCAKKGCWFILRDDMSDQTIRITSKGYRFFVPENAKGRRAVVEGELVVRTLSKEEAQHLADEAAAAEGKAAEQVEGPVREVQLAAVGLELRTAGN